MRKRKYYLRLTNSEYRLIIQCLLNFRNKLLSQNKYTDGIDEVIIKFWLYNKCWGNQVEPTKKKE